ncbi:MAG: hypothetical protein ABEI13_00715 [Candidatus Paceibacteria bacterium]
MQEIPLLSLFKKKTVHIQLAEQVASKLDLNCEILQERIAFLRDTREGGTVYIHSRYEFEIVDPEDYYLLEKILPEFYASRWELVFKIKVYQEGKEKCPPMEVINGMDFLNAMRWYRWMLNS